MWRIANRGDHDLPIYRLPAAYSRLAPPMEKRAKFKSDRLGVALILPQMLLVFTFFYWPAGEALFWAFTLQRPWGGGNEWVGFANFRDMLSDPIYWNSV